MGIGIISTGTVGMGTKVVPVQLSTLELEICLGVFYHDVSRYQRFAILILCMPRYFFCTVTPILHVAKSIFVILLHSSRHFDYTGNSSALS